jgi:hypothetical protein
MRSEPCPDLPGFLTDKSVMMPAIAFALAAFGWSPVEPLLPAHLARTNVTPATIGLMFTISAVVFGIATSVIGWVSKRVAITKVIAGGSSQWRLVFRFWTSSPVSS